MATSDIGHALIASDAWGTRMILDLCGRLTQDQFMREFPIGLGSLHKNLTHIVSVMRRWTDRIAERTPRPMLHTVAKFPHLVGADEYRSPAELRGLLDEAERDLLGVYGDWRGRLEATLEVEWPGDDGAVKRYTFTRGVVIAHLTTHGYHHRAQCLNMLRHLNVPGISDALPEPSAVDWQAAVELPAVVVP